MGGASGHITHVTDDHDLTFSDIKNIIYAACAGTLEHATVKFDGINLMYTRNSSGRLRFARSKTDLLSGGLDERQIAAKFAWRGHVEEAFMCACRALSQAMSFLPRADNVFFNGARWFSIEIIYLPSRNVISYDYDCIVFHESPIFLTQNNAITRDDWYGVAEFISNIDSMRNAITSNFRLFAPIKFVSEPVDASISFNATCKIDDAMFCANVDDSDMIEKYLFNRVFTDAVNVFKTRIGFVDISKITLRAIEALDAPTLTELKSRFKYNKQLISDVQAFVAKGPALVDKYIEPIETALRNVTAEVFRGTTAPLVENADEEARRIKKLVEDAVADVEIRGDARELTVLKKNLKKLDKNGITAIEGIVFTYACKTYKLTGNFAPVNQIVGIPRYRR